MSPRALSASVALLLVSSLAACNLCGRRSKCGDHSMRPEAETVAKPSPLGPPRTGLPPSPDLAVVITEEGIVTLDGTGQRVRTVVPEAEVSWCRVDPRSNVLWFRHGEVGTLSLLDLESDGPPVIVLEQAPETVVIGYPDADLGRPEDHEFENGVVLHMLQTPWAEAILGCDGDMAYTCFDEFEDLEAERAKRLASLETSLRARPPATEVLEALVERGLGYRPPPAPAPGPSPELVRTVSREPCVEDLERCGTAERLPGTPYWLVVVANMRGDFFHEIRQLYDPEAAVFFDPRDPKARSPQPIGGVAETFVPTWVSPSGKLGLGYDTLVTLDGGVLATGFSGVCGFWGGGWEVSSR